MIKHLKTIFIYSISLLLIGVFSISILTQKAYDKNLKPKTIKSQYQLSGDVDNF